VYLLKKTDIAVQQLASAVLKTPVETAPSIAATSTWLKPGVNRRQDSKVKSNRTPTRRVSRDCL